MANFKFISHQKFPEDPYTKELVYLEIDAPARVAFIRKPGKNGGEFWSVSSIGVIKDGVKAYYESYLQDSAFLDKDIKRYLDEKSWEKKSHGSIHSTIDDSEVPF